MRYFQATVQKLRGEIPTWPRRHFGDVTVTKSDEDRLVLAIMNRNDVRIVAEKTDNDEVCLECRSYEELQPLPKPFDLEAQSVYERVARKIGESWAELNADHLPVGEAERSAKRTNPSRELQKNTAVLRYLRGLLDEEKPPEYKETLHRYEAEHQKLEQRLENLRRELDEIFAVDAELVVEEDTSSAESDILTTPVVSNEPKALSRDQKSDLQFSTEDDLRQCIETIAADVGTPQWWEQISVLHYRYKHVDPKHTISKMAVLLHMDEKHVGKQIRKYRPKTP